LHPYDREDFKNSGKKIAIKELKDKIDRGQVISVPF
jgi:hypothetical protein